MLGQGSGGRAGYQGSQSNHYFPWSPGILTLQTGLSKVWILQHVIYISNLTLETNRKSSQLWKDVYRMTD